MKQSKNLLSFGSFEEINSHAKENFLSLVVYKSIVYDLTDFQYQHPGGNDALQQYIGQCLDNVLFNQKIHKHAPQIITYLEKMKYGILLKPEFFLNEPKQNLVIAQSPKNIGKTRKFLQNFHEKDLHSPFSSCDSQNTIQNKLELEKQFSFEQVIIPSDECYKVMPIPKMKIKLISSFITK